MFVGPFTRIQLINVDHNDAIIDIVTVINFQSHSKYLCILIGRTVETACILPLNWALNSSNTQPRTLKIMEEGAKNIFYWNLSWLVFDVFFQLI